MSYYSKKHYRLLSNGYPDTAETIERRKQLRRISEQVQLEMEQKYPVLNTDNIQEALLWQEIRIRELEKSLK